MTDYKNSLPLLYVCIYPSSLPLTVHLLQQKKSIHIFLSLRSMAEAIFTSLYSSITSYFTPTYLFCFLNLMIGTIFIASNFKSHKEEEDHQHQLDRVPSLLERVKSIDFSLYRSQQPDPTQLEPAPSLLQRVKSFSLYKDQRPDLHSDHTHYHPDPVHTQQVQVQVQEHGKMAICLLLFLNHWC